MNLKKISYCLACVLVNSSINAAVQPPRNTLDIKQPMLTTNTFGTNSVTQSVNLPLDIKNQVIPSTAVIVGEQVSQAQQAQLSPEQRKALKEIELESNEQLMKKGHLYLNEVYDLLGIEKTNAGRVVGWMYDEKNPTGDNLVDFGMYDSSNERKRMFINGYERSILLDFNVDGVITV